MGVDSLLTGISAGTVAVVAAVLIAVAYWRERAKARWHQSRASADIESLHDDIWELKEAAAARHRAEAASEAKSRFLATVSHEVRTPLNGILGMANLLAETTLDGEQRSYVEAIRTSGSALASLIDEILDFSRIEAGKLDLVDADFDLVALVEGAVELLAPRAQGKGLEIATSVAPDVPRRLIGDAARLRQILLNLAGNAVKFTEKGGIGVRVTLTPAGAIRFAIADTGPGIPPDRRAAIFDEFEQVDGSASRHYEGTGLGLAISKRIAERMGGSVTLDHSSPRGSIFAVIVPLRAAAEPATATAEINPSLAGRRALIVGQSPFEAPYLGERLAAAGADVVRAEGVDAALALLAEGTSHDIVIVDCALGEEATRRLAGAARDAGVARSLVLFSPFERRAFGQNSLSAFDGWLVKPVRSGSLIARLVSSSDGAAMALPIDSDEAEAAARPSGGWSVLVAEDNDINALLVRKQLERLGASVTRARDGHEAARLGCQAVSVERPAFDLVLMDIRMPGIDGHEATRRIREAEAKVGGPRMKIVALTANAFDEDRRAAMQAGIDGFLTKPVEVAELARLLSQVHTVSA